LVPFWVYSDASVAAAKVITTTDIIINNVEMGICEGQQYSLSISLQLLRKKRERKDN
jgi:hypothetical protein